MPTAEVPVAVVTGGASGIGQSLAAVAAAETHRRLKALRDELAAR